ncbi:MAG: glycoside hydrolase, partial [Candidatus Melainabacteria bacterium HGW-Melainabacteria-1]
HQPRRCPIATRPAGAKTLLDPQALDSAAEIARGVFHQVQQHALGTEIWLGETGHAQCGGQAELSDRFASSLWWLDQLGLLALQGTKVQIRQSLLGSDYGLLDEETLTPRPDYWASWLWKQWMGKEVLTAQQTGPSSLRSYAHCRPDRQGFALLLINLGEQPQSVYLPYPGNRARVYELTGPELDAKVLRVNGQVLSYANAMPELPSRPFTQNLTLAPISASFVVFDNPNWPGCQS